MPGKKKATNESKEASAEREPITFEELQEKFNKRWGLRGSLKCQPGPIPREGFSTQSVTVVRGFTGPCLDDTWTEGSGT